MANTSKTDALSFFLRKWLAFWKTLRVAFSAFLTAFFYCATVLVLAGGSGIWVPAVIPNKEVGIDAVTTFVMATLAPIGADLIFKSEINEKKLSKLWRASLLFFCALAGALAFTALLREKQGDEWTTGWIAACLSLAIWMAVALKSGQFHPETSISGSIGGDLTSPNQLSGSGLS
jgi:hypothetical protein